MIYLLYGQPGSGKTTLGKLLADHLDTPFIIDGDEFRRMFTLRAIDKYGPDGREENISNANAVATYLNKKGKDGNWTAVYCRETPNSIKGHPVNKQTHVVMCLVNPYEHLRKDLKQNNEGQVMEILLESERELRKDHHVLDFEIGTPDLIINTDSLIDDTWHLLSDSLRKDA